MPDEPTALPPSAPPPPTGADYEAIHAAVMETLRGRWFLAEFARRNRNADTDLILAAIQRVQGLAHEQPAAAAAERVRFDLVEMAKAIAQTRSEIASIKPDGDKGSLSEASEELDSIVHTTERATSDILAAAEQVQEIAWTLRERGADPEVCDALDRRATDIYTACSFQDLTGQRTRKVVDVLRFLEDRIRAMIEIWGDAGPAPASAAAAPHLGDAAAEQLDQPDIDRIMPAPAATAAPAVTALALDQAAGLSFIASRGASSPAPCQPYAIGLDDAAPWPTSEAQPEPDVAHEPAPVAAREAVATLPPEPIAVVAAPIPEPQSEPQAAHAASPVAAPEPEAASVPEPIAVVAAPQPEPQPEPEVAHTAEPVVAHEPAAPTPEPAAVEAAHEPETAPEPEMAPAADAIMAPAPETDATHASDEAAEPSDLISHDASVPSPPTPSPQEPAEAAPAPIAVDAESQPEPEVACKPEPVAAPELEPEPVAAHEPEPAATAEPSPEPAADATASATRNDPTEMLRRILALIRPTGAALGESADIQAPGNTSSEDGRLVATIAVSEIEEAGHGAATAGPQAARAAAAKAEASADTSNLPIGRMTVDQAVSELLLKALARATAAAPRPTAAPAAATSEPNAAEVPAPTAGADAPHVEPATAEETADAAPVAAAPLVGETTAELDAVVQAEAPVARDTPDLSAASAPEPIAPEPPSAAHTLPTDDPPVNASASAEPLAEERVTEEAPEAAAPAAAAPPPAEPARPPATAVVLPLTQPAAASRPDGLAAFRSLSDEDKIALFS